MAEKVNINFRMDADLKKEFEEVLEELGLNMTSAFTIFAKKVAREKRIPFELALDPFYSKENLDHLRRGLAALEAGLGEEHNLSESEET